MAKHYNKAEMKERRRDLRKAQTFCEKIVWIYLRKRKTLGLKFRRQYSIDKYIIDLYCPREKIAIEIDGDIHDFPDQKEYDKKRQEYLEDFGIDFIRVKNEELLGNANKAFDRIEYEIKSFLAEKSKE